MRRLILTADDFGLGPGVTAGIVRAMDRGLVGQASIMACHPGAAEHVRPWAGRLAGRLGVHLQLTAGQPCLKPAEVPSLIGREGRFPRSWRQLTRLDPKQVEREWRAQIERVKSWGICPSHLDSHHHVHQRPDVFLIYCQLARELGLPARTADHLMTRLLRAEGVVCADYCEINWSARPLSVDGLIALVKEGFARLDGRGTMELVCHPGEVDEELKTHSTYVAQRARELEVLCSPRLARRLVEMEVQVTPLGELKGEAALAD